MGLFFKRMEGKGGGRMNRERLLNVDWGSRKQEKMIREVENCEGSGSWKPREAKWFSTPLFLEWFSNCDLWDSIKGPQG